jgi:uncharacterized protein (UPF0332 family)
MITENIQALVKYRLEQADEALIAAGVLLEKGLDRQAINRAYYAMFYGVLALLATRKLETSKHSGAVSLFDREFIRPGTFSKDLSHWLHDAFDLRQRSDYTVEFHVTGDEAKTILDHAVSFVGEVKVALGKLTGNPAISAP